MKIYKVLKELTPEKVKLANSGVLKIFPRSLQMVSLGKVQPDVEIEDNCGSVKNILRVRELYKFVDSKEMVEVEDKVLVEVQTDDSEKSFVLSKNYGLVLHSTIVEVAKIAKDFLREDVTYSPVFFGPEALFVLTSSATDGRISFSMQNSYSRSRAFSLKPVFFVEEFPVSLDFLAFRKVHVGGSQTFSELVKSVVQKAVEVKQMEGLIRVRLEEPLTERDIEALKTRAEKYGLPKPFYAVFEEDDLTRSKVFKMAVKLMASCGRSCTRTRFLKIDKFLSQSLRELDVFKRLAISRKRL